MPAVEFAAGIELAIGKLSDSVDRLHKTILGEQAGRPHPATLIGAVQSSSTALVTIGGPPGGMVWEIERITLGTTPNGNATGGTAVLYRSGVEILRTATVPNVFTGRRYQFLFQPGDQLQVVWSGGTGGPLIVDVAAAEMPILRATHG